LTFIRLGDLIINTECIATARLSNYSLSDSEQAVPVVNICLMLPECSIEGNLDPEAEHFYSVETLEFEGELALELWNHLTTLETVKLLSD
jgi:hypothetical protein